MVRIDTGRVKSVASNIQAMNDTVSGDFDTLEKEIARLNKNWDGSGSDAATRVFDKIKKMDERRHAVVKDMVRFIKCQAGDNYEQTEAAISSAAAAFK